MREVIIKALDLTGWSLSESITNVVISEAARTIYLYYSLNQFSWYILHFHLKGYKKLAQNYYYDDLKREIKTKERWIFSVVIALNIILIFTWTLLSIAYYLTSNHLFLRLLRLLIWTMTFSLGVFEIYLNRKLINTMKTSLNFYYKCLY